MSMKSKTVSNTSSRAVEPAFEALRSHYQEQVTEYEQAAAIARSQLEHIEALTLQVSVAPVRSFDTSSLKPAQAQTKAKTKLGAASGSVSTPANVAEVPATTPTKTAKAAKTTKPAAKPAKMAAITKAPAGRGKRVGIAVAPKAEAPKAKSKQQSKGGNGKLKMKASYQGKTMLDAIGMVLQANQGKAVSADNVVNSLYGALSDEQFRVAKDRVTKSLSKGKIDAMWDRVPNQLGVYTISASSLK
jgi:hypothetical protein